MPESHRYQPAVRYEHSAALADSLSPGPSFDAGLVGLSGLASVLVSAAPLGQRQRKPVRPGAGCCCHFQEWARDVLSVSAMGQVDADVVSQCDAADERALSAGAIQSSQPRFIFWRVLNRSTHVFEQSGVRQE